MAIKPCGYNVLVRPDNVAERQGQIFLPQAAREREQYAQVFGTVAAVGPLAWADTHDGKPWAAPGDRVAYAKYGGFLLEDPETKEHYRLLLDKDITAIVSGEYKLVNEGA